ncbi:hypothetical protein [Streptomyces goshikiensis]|uniref:hypothetical protein n=1 Tax=Streptomyces goshikiensis TaxID=1942 RepID=UPI003690D405
MITASRKPGTPRSRTSAGPLRLLWLAALLFGFLYTHAAGADSASAHALGVMITAPQPTGEHATADDDHGHGHGRSGTLPTGHGDGGGHTPAAETCDAGHTQQGGDLPPPKQGLQSTLPGPHESTANPRADGGCRALPPLRSSVGSVVQRV